MNKEIEIFLKVIFQAGNGVLEKIPFDDCPTSHVLRQLEFPSQMKISPFLREKL